MFYFSLKILILYSWLRSNAATCWPLVYSALWPSVRLGKVPVYRSIILQLAEVYYKAYITLTALEPAFRLGTFHTLSIYLPLSFTQEANINEVLDYVESPSWRGGKQSTLYCPLLSRLLSISHLFLTDISNCMFGATVCDVSMHQYRGIDHISMTGMSTTPTFVISLLRTFKITLLCCRTSEAISPNYLHPSKRFL